MIEISQIIQDEDDDDVEILVAIRIGDAYSFRNGGMILTDYPNRDKLENEIKRLVVDQTKIALSNIKDVEARL